MSLFPMGKDCPLCRGGLNEWGHTEPCYAVQRVIEVARNRCREAVPEWAPELRAALAALPISTGKEG